jgi:hypothetical protein
MQTPVYTGTPTVTEKWYKTRTVIAGLWLLFLAVLYFAIVLPIANAEVPPASYRFPFSFITLIYAADLTILGIDYVYKLARRPKPTTPERVTKLNVLGMCLRTAFMVSVGGSYVTGAAVATPTVFAPILTYAPFLGSFIGFTTNYLHSLFALLLIVFGSAIVIFELAKIGAHKSTWKDWLGKGRYPEIKVFYYLIAITVIIQGILGLYLLGSISPFGPYSFLVGNNSYGFETLIRHLHGPLGALIFALFTNHIYFRIRPEWRIN